MALLDNLVNISISISTAAVDAESFDNILLVGPAPTEDPEAPPPTIGVYSELSEVADAGFKTSGEGADPIGLAAAVWFMNNASPLYIAVQQKKDGGPDKEDIADTLARALETTGGYGIAAAGLSDEELEAAAAWAEANSKLFGYTTKNTTSPVNKSYFRSFGFYTKEGTGNQLYTHVAMFGQALGYTAGSETWAYKTLSGIEPSTLSTTEIASLEAAGLNYYVYCSGKNITLNGKVLAGEWIDTIRFRDWLQNDMQMRIFNLFVTNPKVPFGVSGITAVENQIISALRQGQQNGGVAETEYDDDGKEILGYTVTVPSATAVSSSDRAERLLSGCRFNARLAGAIHLVDVKGNLTT